MDTIFFNFDMKIAVIGLHVSKDQRCFCILFVSYESMLCPLCIPTKWMYLRHTTITQALRFIMNIRDIFISDIHLIPPSFLSNKWIYPHVNTNDTSSPIPSQASITHPLWISIMNIITTYFGIKNYYILRLSFFMNKSNILIIHIFIGIHSIGICLIKTCISMHSAHGKSIIHITLHRSVMYTLFLNKYKCLYCGLAVSCS